MPKHIRRTSRHRWTAEEDNKLREMVARHASTAEYKQVFYFLVPSAIYARKRKLGLISSRTKWNQREDEIVKNNFFNPDADWKALLPNRTVAAIRLRAKHLGLSIQKTKGCRWSTDEDEFVRMEKTGMGGQKFRTARGVRFSHAHQNSACRGCQRV